MKNLRWIRSYPLAILTVFLALQAKWFVQPFISTSPPFITFLAAIMVTAWYGGFRPALFATLLSAVLINYYFIFPIESFHTTPADYGTLAFFGMVALTMAYAIAHLQKARQEAVTTQKRLEHLHGLSRQLLNEDDYEHMLQSVLTAVLELLGAVKGVIHLYDPVTHTLNLATHVGFGQEDFSIHFNSISINSSSCGVAFQRKERVFIKDIATDPTCLHLAALPAMSDVVSAQSMPFFRVDHSVFGVLTTYHARPSTPSEGDFHLVDLYASQAERILEAKYQEDRLRRVNMKLEAHVYDLSSELAVTEERERHELASELHDYLGQLLTLAHIKLSLAQRSMRDAPRKSEQYIQEAVEVIMLSHEYARTLIAELCPPVLYDAGLPAAVQWLARQMANNGLNVELHITSESWTLPKDRTVLLYRSIRELLMNVVKHAMVDRARVSMSVDSSNTLVIGVQDEGGGFDTSAATHKDTSVHFGLRFIRERLTIMGGRCQVDSLIGRGTTVTLSLPLDRPSSSDALRAARPISRTA
jgi:signal transduction histidine kinase